MGMADRRFIRSVALKKGHGWNAKEFPFHLPAVKQLNKLTLHKNVTFIVGENGSGKSTVLEAIAASYGFNPEGGTKNFMFSTFDSHTNLHEHISLIKGSAKPDDGFFFRAESYYNVATHIEELDKEQGSGNRIIKSYGDTSLHKQSHGESFMSLFLHRFGPNSLYILDEPEAALSPSRQLTLISRLHELVEEGCQFIIATHSPILLAYPNSVIYQLNEGYEKVTYEESDHYQITKSFLDYPKRMLDVLMSKPK
ncbi:AAA family ATPase [Bacillus sp. 1P06AnD]|uniref:AAA family ATPase n=1 Tax=Bacillus sp. 1P06AnD TaxID=3132208 RepID=UPI00399F0E74